MRRSLSDFDVSTLAEQFQKWGFKPTHAPRLLRHFYQQAGHADLSALNLGKALEHRIAQELSIRHSAVLSRCQAEDGTVKLLIGFGRKNAMTPEPESRTPEPARAPAAVESVLMPAYDPTRAAACVSSQIGCAMGCDFCASTKRGLERDLDAGEIVEQFLHLKEEAARQNRRLRTLVFMGMGEPMLNLDNVIAAIRRIGGAGMGELGWRQITVSTVGIVPGIDRLAEADLNVHLAVSLHAPDDATRARIVPAGRRYGPREVMDAARRFHARTGRIVTIEYCLLDHVNDSDEQALLLADLMAGFRAHVNLIPYNSIGAGLSGFVYRTPPKQRMDRFLQLLRDRGVVAHFRRTRGDDVSAACGQLRETTLLR